MAETRYYRVVYDLLHNGNVSLTSYMMSGNQPIMLTLANNNIAKVTGIATVDQAVAILQRLDKAHIHLQGLLFP
jgi:hypothetical protein